MIVPGDAGYDTNDFEEEKPMINWIKEYIKREKWVKHETKMIRLDWRMNQETRELDFNNQPSRQVSEPEPDGITYFIPLWSN